jgi:hypothetical protein
MKIPESEYTISALIDKHHESIQGEPRPHMGASLLGHPCDRWLWLSFRMAVVEKFPGRILRLFRRGQNEEAQVVSDLRAIGLNVQKTGTNQARVDFGCHVSGSIDGIIESGVPEAPKTPHVLEIKTHAKKSFDDLVKVSVEKSKPMHYVQMQMYMAGVKADRALYVAVCKDDDRIHTERVKLDKAVAQKAIDRGHRLVKSERMPPPLSTDPTWFECRFCAAHEFCHKTQLTKEVNCRTCTNSTAREDSTWHCEQYDVTLDFENQKAGCEAHVLHPDLVPWPHKVKDNVITWITPQGDIKNGVSDWETFTSREIVANPTACASGDRFVEDMRENFGAKVVG